MRWTRTISIVGVAVAALDVAAVGADASSAELEASADRDAAAAVTRDDAAPVQPPAGPPINFVSVCNLSHAASDDPIVFPGRLGASHLYQFFGNTSTDAVSTPDSLAAAGTTCTRLEDTAAYWVPALYDNGVAQRPSRAQAYYTPAGKDPSVIEALPHDLRVIAGGTAAPDAATRWGCIDPDAREPLATDTTVPTCADGTHLAARIVFPDCWDVVSTDSEDHRSHLTYSRRGTGPDSHSVSVPRLRLTVADPDADGGDDVVLASGGPETLHADFLNTWDQVALETLVTDRINAERRCGIIGGPGGR